MQVRELIRQLSAVPQDLEVVISSDEEGNDGHFLKDMDLGYFDGDDFIAEEDREEYDAKEVLILWP